MYAPKYAERGIFEITTAEELPNEVRRSALQRVIQILKYQRDAYYSKLSDGDDIKPISALITTMVSRIASNYGKKNCSVFELLEYVLNRLEMCIHQTEMTFEQYALRYDNSPVLSYKTENGMSRILLIPMIILRINGTRMREYLRASLNG